MILLHSPYIADTFVNLNDPDMPLKGISINDPIIADDTLQQQIVIPGYVHYWNNLMYLNDSFVEAMDNLSSYCNYTQYMDKYFKFPPPNEKYPVLPSPYDDPMYTCDIFDIVYSAELLVNPCFNICTSPHHYRPPFPLD